MEILFSNIINIRYYGINPKILKKIGLKKIYLFFNKFIIFILLRI